MRDPSTWKSLLEIEPAFEALEADVLAGRVTGYAQIPPELFACHAWDLIPTARLFPLLQPFLRQTIQRAKVAMPEVYGERLAHIEPESICSPEDWFQVPILVKDDDEEAGLRGFRRFANAQPEVLRPTDFPGAPAAFGSGGSQGRYTPTYVSLADRAREIQGWRRGHDYHGLIPGDRALYTYNTTHKGGQWMQESLWQHGVEVHLRRLEESPYAVLENIHRYNINLLFTVQQPYEAMQRQAKAAGINLHSLVAASLENPEFHGLLVPDDSGKKQVEFIFLGGFEIVPYALELARDYLGSTPVASLLGSSEAIPQACSTNPQLTPSGMCHYNNMHLLHGPHYIEVVKRQGSAWVPVQKGEEGWLVYTSWARDGTLWVRYAPGDAATLLLEEGECPCGLISPVITAVHRKDLQERESLLLEGCAAG
jgi:phenylacetate-CoA ligase